MIQNILKCVALGAASVTALAPTTAAGSTRPDKDSTAATTRSDNKDLTAAPDESTDLHLPAISVSRRDLPPLLSLAPLVGGMNIPAANVPASLAEGDATIRSLWLSRLAYPTMIAALDHGIFDALKKPLGLKDLATTVRLPESVIENVLMPVCGALGLITQENEKYRIVDAVRPFLVKESPYFFGPQLLAADGLQSSLRRSIARAGNSKPPLAAHSDAAVESFAATMEAHSAATAALAAETDIFRNVRSVLDMAGGCGVFSRVSVEINSDQ